MPEYRVYDSILDAVGRTPASTPGPVSAPASSEIFVQARFLNPMGDQGPDRQVHDREGRAEGRSARRHDRRHSSGNTALGLAMAAPSKATGVKMVVRDSLGPEKVKFLKGPRREVVQVDHRLPPESPDSYNNITPGSPARRRAATTSTSTTTGTTTMATTGRPGRDLEADEGRIDLIVAGVGTGGPWARREVSEEQDPRIRVVGVDPEGSVFFDTSIRERRPSGPTISRAWATNS